MSDFGMSSFSEMIWAEPRKQSFEENEEGGERIEEDERNKGFAKNGIFNYYSR